MINEEKAQDLLKKWENVVHKKNRSLAEEMLDLENAVIIESREKWILCRYYDGFENKCIHKTLDPKPDPMCYESCMECSERD